MSFRSQIFLREVQYNDEETGVASRRRVARVEARYRFLRLPMPSRSPQDPITVPFRRDIGSAALRRGK